MNDNDLDRRLTEYGDRWRTTQPGPPMPNLPSTSPVRRWLPVVAVAAAAALIAVGVTVAVKASGGDDEGLPATGITPVDLAGAIPWIDSPSSPPHFGPVPARCTSGDLVLRSSGTEGATGHLLYYFRFSNSSESACTLSDRASVTLSAPGMPDATASPDDFVHFGPGTVVLAPDDKANVALVTQSVCEAYPGGGGPLQTYNTVKLRLPGDSGTLDPATQVVTDQQISLNGCPLGVSRFWSDEQERSSDTQSSSDEVRSFDLSLESPSAAIAGDTLVYVVTLTNATEHKIQLVDNCPSYSERLTDYRNSEPLIYGGYLLNCADAGSIPAQSSLRFEMRLDVPRSATAGEYDLAWNFQGTDLPGTRTAIDVVEP